MSFVLRKWYFDLATPGGDAAVAYWATLSAGPVRVLYSSILLARAGAEVTTETSHATCPEPERNERGVTWRCEPLGADLCAEGVWSASRAWDLRQDEPGSVSWMPGCLNAAVRLSVRGVPLAGRGYAELIEIRTPVWRLPIDRLHWGRWIGAASARTWIRWEGEHPLRLVLPETPGPASQIEISPQRVLAPGTDLHLERQRTLRDGALGATVLGKIPGVRSWAPAAMLAAVETKWLSRGTLRENGGVIDGGWAIHELVRFRGES